MTCDLKLQIILVDLRVPEEEAGAPLRVQSHPETTSSQLPAKSIWIDEDTTALANRFGALRSFDKMKLSAALLLATKEFRHRGPQPTNLSRTEALETREFFRFRQDPGLLSFQSVSKNQRKQNARAKTVTVAGKPGKAPVIDCLQALKKSLAAQRTENPHKRAAADEQHGNVG
jgi:hypothetical protein